MHCGTCYMDYSEILFDKVWCFPLPLSLLQGSLEVSREHFLTHHFEDHEKNKQMVQLEYLFDALWWPETCMWISFSWPSFNFKVTNYSYSTAKIIHFMGKFIMININYKRHNTCLLS